MKTTPEHRLDEVTKRLFCQLFDAQCELERYADNYDQPARSIVSAIDQLLEMILEYTDE